MSEKAQTANPEEYVVGYAKPPLHTRFVKGQSGNPRGRPKGSRNLATVLEQELNAPVTINENGERKTITKLEAAIKQLVNKTVNGDTRALQQLLGLYRVLDASASEAEAAPLTRESEEQVMRGILKRIQRNAPGDSDDAC